MKINSVNPWYLIINKVDEYIDESNGTKNLTLDFSEKNKDTLKKYTKLWDKVKDLIRSVANTLGNYDKQYMKIKFNSDDKIIYL